MKLPDQWVFLPYQIREKLIDIVDLEYDPYESSKAEIKESLLYGEIPSCCRNYKTIQTKYKSLTEEEMRKIVEALILDSYRQLLTLENFLVS